MSYSIDEFITLDLYFNQGGGLSVGQGAGACLFIVQEPDSGIDDNEPIIFKTFQEFESFYHSALEGMEGVLEAAEAYFGQQPSPQALVVGFANTKEHGDEGTIDALQRIKKQNDDWEMFCPFVEIKEPQIPQDALLDQNEDPILDQYENYITA